MLSCISDLLNSSIKKEHKSISNFKSIAMYKAKRNLEEDKEM